VNAVAEDSTVVPQFDYFEDAQDYLRKKLAADKDTVYFQKVGSAFGRLLPKRGKK
jgi:hypothetical protein